MSENVEDEGYPFGAELPVVAQDGEGDTELAPAVQHAPGGLVIPDDYGVLEGSPNGSRRGVAVVVALGCVIRGETPHFDYVAGEAASGLQLAALETGVPVAFGVLTCDTSEQAEARVEKGAEAVRTALEMADLFAQLRTSVAAAAK